MEIVCTVTCIQHLIAPFTVILLLQTALDYPIIILQTSIVSLCQHLHTFHTNLLNVTILFRDFNLLLKPETRFFHKNFTLTIDGQKSSSQLAKIHLYSGVDQSKCRDIRVQSSGDQLSMG